MPQETLDDGLKKCTKAQLVHPLYSSSTLTVQNRKLIWRCTSLLERCIEAVLQRKQSMIFNVYKFKSYVSWQHGLYTGQDTTLLFNHVLSLSTYREYPQRQKDNYYA
jgi:hypothetical protein